MSSLARRIAVAVSGGIDSIALLHCTCRTAGVLGLQVHALHVHHGLHPDATRWRDQVADQVRRWSKRGLPVSFHEARLDGAPGRGESIEAWARRERYRALARLAVELGCGIVLLAQHRRDQAETVLLQMLRGAGPSGLAAMPSSVDRGALRWCRPWLDQPRRAIESYVHRHRLGFVRDPGNEDPRFARNRLRHRVWPVLQAAFPDVEAALASSARRSHEAALCLAELAEIDARQCVAAGQLCLPRWQSLSLPRRSNLLRWWLASSTGLPIPETLVHRVVAEARQGSAMRWPLGAGWLQLHRDRLSPSFETPTVTRATSIEAPAPRRLDLSSPGRHALPEWDGAWMVTVSDGAGLPAEVLSDVVCQARQGGEQFALAAGRPARSLKKQLQAAGIARWSRRAPLLTSAGRLLFVPGLGIEAFWHPRLVASGLVLRWVPGAGPASGPG